MSQTSATAGREAQSQSSNPRLYQAMGEEIDRLTSELEGAHAQAARSRQEWQTRIEEAEQRAEEAERELSRIQCSLAEFNNAWRDMGQAYANVTGQNQDLNPAGQGEHEAHSRRSGSDQDIVMTGDGATTVSDRPTMPKSRGGSQNIGNPLPHEPSAVSRLGSDLHYESSLQRSSLSSRTGLKRPFEPAVGGLESPSLRRPPPPVPTHLQESPPHQPSFAETIGPSDRDAAPSHVAGGETDLTNKPEHLANMQEASPTGGESPRSTDSESDSFPPVSKLVRRARIASAARAIPRRHTPVPGIHRGPWNLQGPDSTKRAVRPFFENMLGKNEPDTSDQPEEQNP